MMNKYNPADKDIRFIDSHYKDLFQIPDGGCIQIQYPDETVVKPCKFIDEYHTQIGYNVFHICEFAEIMERRRAIYQAEPEIMGNEAAWRVGRDSILALQTCEDGYDYTLLDENYNNIDGGQLDNPDLSMIEARKEILESFGLENRELRAMIYEDVMERAFGADKEAWMAAFLESTTDAYAILQLKQTNETWGERFESLSALQRHGKEPDIDHYEVVYVGALPSYTDQALMLESLYTRFNIDHPDDFRGHSISVSDIVAIKTGGVVSCHYVDSVGFQELPGFMKPENYLKNAEMAMEDDYGMLDGIINNGKAAGTEERSSVLEQLKEMPVSDKPRKPTRSHLERDMG